MIRLPDPDASYAILVGTSSYRSAALNELPSVRNNLNTLATLLTSWRSGFRADRCIVIHDPDDSRRLYRDILRYAKQAEDTLLIYFAGHGLTGPGRNELYLCLASTEPDEHDLPVSAFPIEFMHRIFQESPARNRVLMLDCCYSGRAAQDVMAIDDDVILGQVDINGTYTLTASPANERAVAPINAPYTAFTGELIDLIRKGIPGGHEYLALGDIYRRVRYSMSTKNMPEPRQRGTDSAHLLALSRNVAYTKQSSDRYDGGPSNEKRQDHEGAKNTSFRFKTGGDYTGDSKPNRPPAGDPQKSFDDLLAAILTRDRDIPPTLREDRHPSEYHYHKFFGTDLLKSLCALTIFPPALPIAFLVGGGMAQISKEHLGPGNYLALCVSVVALLSFGGGMAAAMIEDFSDERNRPIVSFLAIVSIIVCVLAGYIPAHSGHPWLDSGHVGRIACDWMSWRF